MFEAGTPPPDTTPPTVSSRTPASGATGVAVGSVVTATFSEALDAATMGTSTFELRDGSNALVAAGVSYNAAGNTATLTPSAPLLASTTYTVTLRGGATDPRIKDVAGNALAASASWSFTTAAAPAPDTTPPTVSSRTPASGATGVAVGSVVTATFSEALDPATVRHGHVRAARRIERAGGRERELQRGGQHGDADAERAVAGLDDVHGDAARRGDRPADQGRGRQRAGDQCELVVHDGGSLGLPLQRVEFGGGSDGCDFDGHGVGAVGGEVPCECRRLRDGGSLLQGSGEHGHARWQPVEQRRCAAGVGDVHERDGDGLAAGDVCVTGGGDGEHGVRGVLPCAERRVLVRPQFLCERRIDGGSRCTCCAMGRAAATACYVYGTSSAFPSGTYQSTNYWVDVVFEAGTPAPDTTPPTVSSRTPASGATGVAVGSVVTATFSEALDAATMGTSTFELRDGSNALVAAGVSYNAAGNTATLTPSAPLLASTTYTVTLRGGATDPRIKDVAGNALAASASWSFTTAAAPAPDTTPPTVSSRTPASGATGVAVGSVVTATFSEALDPATVRHGHVRAARRIERAGGRGRELQRGGQHGDADAERADAGLDDVHGDAARRGDRPADQGRGGQRAGGQCELVVHHGRFCCLQWQPDCGGELSTWLAAVRVGRGWRWRLQHSRLRDRDQCQSRWYSILQDQVDRGRLSPGYLPPRLLRRPWCSQGHDGDSISDLAASATELPC